jgi:Zn-dependent peptidase ImmA (M78 family)
VISEAAAVVRARAFVRKCGIDAIPVDLAKYLEAANAELRVSDRLSPDEAGNTMFVRGRHLITVNGNDSPERIRFTVLHEIAHIVLDLPSVHGGTVTPGALYSYARRPPEEVVCDTFAAECLLPYEFLRADISDASASFAFVETLAERYESSLACTASRFAANAALPCAYVLSQDGYVRFVALSASMRELRFWISRGIAVPTNSITGQCFRSEENRRTGVVPAYIWTSSDAVADIDVTEDTRIQRTWNQALTLISLEREDVPDPRERNRVEADEEEPLLRELDGVLPWPGKRRRK